MQTETITWHRLPADGLPDAELTVLVAFRATDGAVDTWPGWWSGEHWIDATNGDRMERPNGDGEAIAVLAWSDMPLGVPAC